MPYIDSINIRAKDSTENEEEIQRFDDKLKVALYIYDADSGTYIALDKSHLMSIDGDVYVKVDDLEDLAWYEETFGPMQTELNTELHQCATVK